MSLYIVKDEDCHLVAAFNSDFERIKKLKNLEIYEVTIKQPRNGKFHRKFFALMNITVTQLPEGFHIKTPDGKHKIYIEDVDALLENLKILVGHVEFKFSITGDMYIKTKSISFAKMDDEQFGEFYDKCIDKILKYFLTGSTEQEINDKVLQYL